MANDVYKQPLLIQISIEPRSKADKEKLNAGLAKLVADDPLFGIRTDPESGQIILLSVGEPHIASKIDILKHTYEVDAIIGIPQVDYREKISRPATVDYTYRKQTGGHGQFARIKIFAEPAEPGFGFVFENQVGNDSVPTEFISAVKKGLEGMMGFGVLAGFPVVDVKVNLVDGASHDVDSSATTFEICARAAMREALYKGGSILLEPIMKVEVATPAEYVVSIIGSLNSRRGQIHGQEIRHDDTVITAMAPLANMFSYVNNLRSMSQARATFAMQFDHYAPVPLPNDDPPFRPAIGMRA
jgi:elongation factor G